MHVFQPLPIEMLEFNPFEKFAKEQALVAASHKQVSNAMTISWGGVGVLWGKNVAFIFIRDSRYTKTLIDPADFFSISFVNEKHKKALEYCGSHSGRDEDKIANAGFTWNYKLSIPFIDEGELVMLCHKLSATRITSDSFLSPAVQKWYTDGDMHTMYVGEIFEVMAR